MNTILLSGATTFLSTRAEDAVRVLSGRALVYIVPVCRGEAGRRCLLYEAAAGEELPLWRRVDPDGREWCLLFAGAGRAEIGLLPGGATPAMQRALLEKCGLWEPDVHFDEALSDFYRMRLVREEGDLLRTANERKRLRQRTDALISSALSGEETPAAPLRAPQNYRAMAELCRRAKIPLAPWERVKEICGDDPTVPEIARVSHIPCREVVLEENWSRSDAGTLIVFLGEELAPAACMPGRGYTLIQPGQKPRRLNAALEATLSPKAWMLCRPFPEQPMDARAFIRFCAGCLMPGDIALVLVLSALCSLLGLLLPLLSQLLYDFFIPLGASGAILQIGLLFGVFLLGSIAFSLVRSLGAFRLRSRVRIQVQNAAYHRVFSLPESFFAQYESADLARRVLEVGSLAGEGVDLALSALLGLVSAGFFFGRMLCVSRPLALLSGSLVAAICVLSALLARARMRRQHKISELDGRMDSVMYQFLEAIEKVRMAGIEDRAVYEYLQPFAQQRRLKSGQRMLEGWESALTAAGGGIVSLAVYAAAQGCSLSSGAFAGFLSAMGMFSEALRSAADALARAQLFLPIWERVRPIVQAAPENASGRALPGALSGRIDIEHIRFGYDPAAQVLQDLSLHIAPGEYLAVVGASGCGKSTLLRLLLGFVQPQSGRIYYDSQDMGEMDLQCLRRQFGVVLQDGSLISGTILENILLTRPEATLEEAAQAAAAVGLLEDILAMPMNFQTVVSENCSTLSGGQIQRILIARALISRPALLFFDEATSALDNLSQQTVCDTLARLPITRVVIAHRLSTVRHCDRIVVLENGRVAEEGDFASLMARRGAFYRLASRQELDLAQE